MPTFSRKDVDVAKESLMIELTGNQAKLDAFIRLLDDFTIMEFVRTGITGLGRGAGCLESYDNVTHSDEE